MKCAKIIGVVFLSLLMVFGSLTVAPADTVLIPVIAIGAPNVTTVVSVYNLPGATSTHLKYIYRSKDSSVSGSPNHTGTCSSTSFVRPMFDSDLVSFDASGIFNSGNAMFNDSNTYGGGFGIGLTGNKRAYLLVTHSDVAGNRVNLGGSFGNEALGGEAILMEIGFGAAWGLRAVNEAFREDYNFTITGVETVFGSFGKAFAFFPTSEWTTRFFITPIGDNMDTANLTGKVSLWNQDASSFLHHGLFGRDGTHYAFPSSITADVTCTAGVDLTDMIDSSVLSAVENTGGWAFLQNLSAPPITASANPLIVYKLEYVLEDSTYGGTNNNGYLMSNRDGRPF